MHACVACHVTVEKIIVDLYLIFKLKGGEEKLEGETEHMILVLFFVVAEVNTLLLCLCVGGVGFLTKCRGTSDKKKRTQ